MRGEINSWAIRFCFHQFQHNLFSVNPSISKVKNIGFDEFSTNTNLNLDRFKVDFDISEIQKFVFKKNVKCEALIIKQFIYPNSLKVRIYHKFISLLTK